MPPCKDCEYAQPPFLDEHNLDAWDLWRAVATQWRTGFESLIGLDYTAVYAEAARLDIELSICTMQKIKALERMVIEKQNDK